MNVYTFLEELKSKEVQLNLKNGKLEVQAPEGVLTADLVERLKQSKEEIIALLQQTGTEENVSEIPVAAKKEYYPLSFSQNRLWVLDQFDQVATVFNMAMQYRLNGTIDEKLFAQAFEILVARHEILRTRFVDKNGQPYQHILENAAEGISFESLDYSHSENSNHLAQNKATAIAETKFDLYQDPLLKVAIIKVAEEQYFLSLCIHHIISDEWSMNILVKDVMAIYSGLKNDKKAVLEPLRIQFKDYASWELENIKNETASQQYWLKKLDGSLPVLELVSDHIRPALQTYNGNEVAVQISKENSQKFYELLEKNGTTLFMGAMSLVYTLLYRYSGNDDIIVGAPVSGRKQADLEHQIGFYINTLALRQNIDGASGFTALLQDVKTNILEGYQHQSYPFDLLVDELTVQRDPSRAPLFDVMVVVEDEGKDNSTKFEGVSIEEVPLEKKVSKYDLTFWFKEGASGEIAIHLEYNTDIYSKDRMTRLAVHLGKLLDSVIADATTPLDQLLLLKTEERKTLLEDYQGKKVAQSSDTTLISLFEAQADQQGNALAVKYENNSLSYAALEARSNQLAHYLQTQHHIGKGSIVGVMQDRSEFLLISILGILKAGGAYLPIDRNNPADRVAYMLADGNVSFLLTDTEVSDYAVITKNSTELQEELGNYPDTRLNIAINGEDLAYIIYTSGSTGRPKGVMIRHSSVVNLLQSVTPVFDFSNRDKVLATATFTFDISVFDFFMPLCTGGSLIIATNHVITDPLLLSAMLEENEITIMQATPSVWNVLLEAGWKISTPLKKISTGEFLPVSLGTRLLEIPGALYNMYGPTETTIWSAFQQIKEVKDLYSIGKPICNTTIFLLDKQGQVVPQGIIGNLFIGGAGVAKGYTDAELTTKKFIKNPLNNDEVIYDTGDLCQWDFNGNLVYLGRSDNQVKLRGYRIELGEIETLLLLDAQVNQAVVIVKGDFLLAYVTGKEKLDREHLKTVLQSKLPAYMVPAHIVQLEMFPLTSSGKIDKSALPFPKELSAKTYSAPETEAEQLIAEIWSELLLTTQVGREDNFFELGGNSLKAIQFITRLRNEASLQINIESVFRNPVLKNLARQIKGIASKEAVFIPKAAVQEEYELSRAQRRTWLQVQRQPEATTFNIITSYHLKGILNCKALEESFNALISRHESLRTVFVSKGAEPRQKIVSLEEYNFSIEYRAAKDSQSVIAEFTNHVFDLSKGPLFKATVLENNANDQELFFAIHHIISDEWSMQILVRDLINYYNALVRSEAVSVTPLSVQYKDYAAWQSSTSGSAEFELSRNYWKNHLSDAPGIELASDRPRPAIMSNNGSQYNFSFSTAASEGLKAICSASGSTLFMGVSALVYTLLYRYTGQSDITLGTPVAGRNHADLENQIGLYLNTLALRAEFSGEDNFKDLLSKVKEISISGFNHQSYPFDVLVEDLDRSLEKNRAPLFDVVVILQNVDLQFMKSLKMEGIEIDAKDFDLKTSKSDLRFEFIEREDCIEGSIEYNTDLYDEARMVRMATHMGNLLTAILDAPNQVLNEIEYLEETESETSKWFEKPVQKTASKYIHKSFEEIVSAYPDHTAIVEDNGHTGYAALNSFANQLSGLLLETGLSSNNAVGVLLPGGKELIGSLLACLKTGITYVPLSNSFSLTRMQQAVSETAMKVLITDEASWTVFQSQDIDHEFTHVLVFKASELSIGLAVYKASSSGEYLLSDYSLENYSEENVAVDYPINNSSYIFYSSGTTGKSKAIVGNQESIAHYINWHKNTFGFDTESRVSQIASVTFDASLKDILTSLISGSSLCIPTAKTRENMVLLGQWLSAEKVTILQTVPSLFRLLTNSLVEQNLSLQDIKEVVLAGEKVYGRDVALWRSLSGNTARMSNLYGLTETTVLKSCYHIPEGDLDAGTVLPVGKAIDNSMIAVINDSGLSMWGEIGEVYIKSPYISKGYLDQELTAALLVQNPLVSDREDLVCRTGDLGRYDSDGNLEILGRIDDQIKLHGIRVELDGIRSSLLNLEGVGQVELVLHTDATADSLLCYYTGTEYGSGELRLLLSATLDRSSIPDYFIYVAEFPLTLNGKVDKRALPKPSELLRAGNYEAPSGAIETSLSNIWAELLSIPQSSIGRNDSFFDLGGSSLKAIQLISRVYKNHEVQLSIAEIFSHSTLKPQASLIAASKGNTYLSIQKVAEQDDYAVSHGQGRMWLIEQQVDSVFPFNGVDIYRLKGNLDIEALTQSFKKLIDRHESLRTIFIQKEGRPRQKILNSSDVVVDIETIDISAVPERRSILIEELRNAAFDLSQWPLFRVKLLSYGADVYDLVYVDHHIISDEWSLQVLIQDLVTYYNAFVLKQEVALEPLPIQYKDYAAWQSSLVNSTDFEVSAKYWKTHLQDAPRIELASDRPRPAVISNQGSQYNFSFSKEASSGLKAVCTESGCTLFMGVSSLVYALLYSYTGQSDITLGTPVAGRNHADLEKQIGFYINTLALRAQFKGDDSFEELLDHVKQVCVAGFSHQNYPFDILVHELDNNVANNRSPLFDVLIVLQNVDLQVLESLEMEGLEVTSDVEELKISRGDLRFQFTEHEDFIQCNIEYNTDLYDADRIIRMQNHIENLLAEIVNSPKVSMKELIYLGEEELSSSNWFEKPVQKVPSKYIHKSFEDMVFSYPDRTALIEANGSTSYKSLNSFANQLSGLLLDTGLSSDASVGVLLHSGKELVGSLLACFKTGITYVPLSNSFSLARMQQALSETAMKVLITDDVSWAVFQNQDIRHAFTHVLVFKASGSSVLGDLGLGNFDLISLEQTTLTVYEVSASGEYTVSDYSLESYSEANVAVDYPITNSSYIFYSSGTTGKSKAIVGNQESISHYINWHKNTFGFDTESRVSQIASVTFDASLKDILTSLISGSCLCIPGTKIRENMVLLGQWLSAEKVTILQTVPSLFRLLTNSLVEQNLSLRDIKEVVLAGEKLYGRDISLWRSLSGNTARMSNLYGLTETTVLKSCYHIPEGDLDAGTVLPVGKAIDNSMIAVINDSGLSMWGEIGEVYIKSPYISKGYLDQELTKALLVQNPLVSDIEDLVCRTGDLGRYDSDGNLEILGRIDDQIKLHGVRVELDGIRGSLLNLEGVGQVELLLHTDVSDSLLCYYTGTEYGSGELRLLLSAKLDRSSIPDYFIYVEEFPLTLNGKVDKRALPKPSELLRGSNYEEPIGAIETSLSTIWAELLGVPQSSIGRNNSFFDLGGSSLKAMQLITHVYKKHDIQLAIADIFNYSELKAQATLLSDSNHKTVYHAIPKIAEQYDYALSHAQRRTWLIEQQIEGFSPFNGIEVYRLKGNLDVAALTQAFAQLIDRHESLRTIFILKEGEPRQKIIKSSDVVVNIETIDISETPELRNTITEDLRHQRFDLSSWPLFRVKVLSYGADVYDLVFVDHHIILDQWSMQILVRDLVSYYNGLLRAEESSLEPLSIQYKDYAAWLSSDIGSTQFEVSGKYWKTHLLDAPKIELASDRSRPQTISHQGSQQHFSFSKEASAALKELCSEAGCTLFMGVSALVYTLLYRYTGQSDITLGTPVAGRDHTDLENQIGLYLNTIALRAKFSGEDTFKEVLAQVKQISVAGFHHQSYPFDLLVEELGINAAKNRSPLFDVVVILQNIDLQLESLEMEGLEVTSDNEELKISKGDLRFQFIERKEHIEGGLEYSTDLYDSDRIARMITDLNNLLAGILEKPTTKIRKLNFLSEIQTKKLAAKRASFADDLLEDY
ncbi:amino acid adenylation domain-containing protein [Flavobacterium circumlabens]|uniref:Amino acid adenylation domain-containing protein n=3 Tax=Flavobacterium circumlabens TaxID=2133765 RepID=A0A4Y7U7K0_9FLAO|nr:non-ribosomal peptide synthetase [Flavobacterium circumlabens]TEB42423.1 amino acid adenylation domain-containing protein [Flavobacterium circumlabens]